MENEFVFCYECEESFNCPDACRKDGCEWGLKTLINEENEKNEEA